mmetsp:Transcript_60035/g.169260  ORF Transcript_60035/g.169260 Transcript_60035/m.169260 type:complete len:219 (+) Transcript_60035:275-931(+)
MDHNVNVLRVSAVPARYAQEDLVGRGGKLTGGGGQRRRRRRRVGQPHRTLRGASHARHHGPRLRQLEPARGHHPGDGGALWHPRELHRHHHAPHRRERLRARWRHPLRLPGQARPRDRHRRGVVDASGPPCGALRRRGRLLPGPAFGSRLRGPERDSGHPQRARGAGDLPRRAVQLAEGLHTVLPLRLHRRPLLVRPGDDGLPPRRVHPLTGRRAPVG